MSELFLQTYFGDFGVNLARGVNDVFAAQIY